MADKLDWEEEALEVKPLLTVTIHATVTYYSPSNQFFGQLPIHSPSTSPKKFPCDGSTRASVKVNL